MNGQQVFGLSWSKKVIIVMEKREIAQRASKLQNKEDLLQLLNDIVKDELGSEHSFSFSLKQLTYYAIFPLRQEVSHIFYIM